MDIFRYFGFRLGKGIAVVLAVACLNFVLIHMAPGDPASIMAGEAGAANAEYMQQLRKEFGLDKPYYQQFLIYLGKLAKGNLGYSFRQKRTVSSLIGERLPATLLLTGVAFVLALVLGVVLGAVAAIRAGRFTDHVVTVGALFFYAMPIFWTGLMAVLLFSVICGWLPPFGSETVGSGFTGTAHVVDVLKHLVLPAFTLASFYVAIYTRMTRASVLDVQTLDFVTTAKAKGLSSRRIVTAHILPNAVLPLITLAGMQAGQLIGGTVLVETVFAWPGIGRLAFDALLQRDYPVLLGVFVVTAIMVVIFNIITDLLYLFADPRIEAATT